MFTVSCGWLPQLMKNVVSAQLMQFTNGCSPFSWGTPPHSSACLDDSPLGGLRERVPWPFWLKTMLLSRIRLFACCVLPVARFISSTHLFLSAVLMVCKGFRLRRFGSHGFPPCGAVCSPCLVGRLAGSCRPSPSATHVRLLPQCVSLFKD